MITIEGIQKNAKKATAKHILKRSDSFYDMIPYKMFRYNLYILPSNIVCDNFKG